MRHLLVATAVAAMAGVSAAPLAVHAQDTATFVPPSRPAPTAPGAPIAKPAPAAESVIGTGPNGATMRCKDGSYPAVNAPATACDAKGGVLVRFPLKRTPENAPRRVQTGPVPLPAAMLAPPAIMAEPMRDRSHDVVPAVVPPADATLQCGDGTFVVRDTSSTRCVGKGGVSIIFPPRRRP